MHACLVSLMPACPLGSPLPRLGAPQSSPAAHSYDKNATRHGPPSGCRCDQAAAAAFLASYCAALAGAGTSSGGVAAAPAPCPLPACWPRRPRGTSLSYAAMCYTLLHELGPLHDVFKRRPELWEARSLGEVQAAVWGWLDRWFESA